MTAPEPEVRAQALEQWLRQHEGTFTRIALEQSAALAGYTDAEFKAAWLRVVVADPWYPVRRRLTILGALTTIAAYVATWALFATDFLGSSRGYLPGDGLLQILTLFLGGALAMSLAWTKTRRPDPERAIQSFAVLLSVPLALLISVAGACLPFSGLNG